MIMTMIILSSLLLAKYTYYLLYMLGLIKS